MLTILEIIAWSAFIIFALKYMYNQEQKHPLQ